MSESELIQILETHFPDSLIQVHDMTGSGESFDIRISSTAFSGKSRIQQHQMVYEVLGDLMNSKLHAVKIKTDAS